MSDCKGSKSQNIFPTYGVHNPPQYSPCACPDCLYQRGPNEPSDPLFPLYFTAKWTMYRVFNNYSDHMPPYDGKPPAPLEEGKDYQVSYGETYYDSTWEGPNGERGAMMEHYVDYSLPIFPIENNFTSSFISLGDTAYFLTYDDRPKGMPPICLFSPLNHAPRRDFVKHLPYSFVDSQKLGFKVQGYSLWTSPKPNQPPIQTGATPDRTADGAVLFGYAFHSDYRADAADKTVTPYRHPHSFYFSGFPGTPPDAPVVSQNYTEFAMIKPDPEKTWNQVYRRIRENPDYCECNLFDPPSDGLKGSARKHPDWSGNRRTT